VLKDAELAMYHAKRIGGDRIEVVQAGDAHAQEATGSGLETDLRPRDRAATR